jgi:hypothetical protein
MSVYRTDGTKTNAATGLPQPTGLLLTTVSGVLYSTVPVGEAPGGLNSTPGTDPNTPGNANPGVPYGFTPPIYIGPTQ